MNVLIINNDKKQLNNYMYIKVYFAKLSFEYRKKKKKKVFKK